MAGDPIITSALHGPTIRPRSNDKSVDLGSNTGERVPASLVETTQLTAWCRSVAVSSLRRKTGGETTQMTAWCRSVAVSSLTRKKGGGGGKTTTRKRLKQTIFRSLTAPGMKQSRVH